MTTRKPASLDGSLLARKGAAVPAVPLDSPLTEELGEPRPQATVVQFDSVLSAAPPVEAAPPPAEGSKLGRIAVLLGAAAVFAGLAFALVKYLPSPAALLKNDAKSPAVAAPVPTPESSAAPVPVTPPAVEPSPKAALAPADAQPVEVNPVKVAGVAPNPPAPVVLSPEPTPAVAAREQAEAPPPPRPAAKAKPAPHVRKHATLPLATSSGPYMLQIAAVQSPAAARREAARLEKKLGALLGKNRITAIKAVGADHQPVYRLRVGGYASRSAAHSACRRIKQHKVDCLVVRR